VSAAFHIAELNIARAIAPIDSPVLDDFNAALDPINALADGAPGFVWRLQDGDGNATSIRAFDDERMIVNLSVWESVEDLIQFVYKSGHTPSLDEAIDRLEHLREHGPTPYAFTFKARFEAGASEDRALIDDEVGCPA
jgi:hypothetical protein